MDQFFSRMMGDINQYSPEDTICKWNLTRICYVIVLVMLLEIVNLFDVDVRNTHYLLATSCVILAAGLVILPLSLWILKRFDSISIPNKHRLYLYFWTFLPTIVAFSFFIRDAQADRPPLNLLIIIGLIAMVPVLEGKETVMVFVLPAITNLAVYAAVSGNVTYMLYSAIFCLAGVMITVVVHRQYIFMIRELNYQMLHDSLTHLLSRQAGSEQAKALLSACAREKRCFAVVMMDIDFFKAYNDAKGHLYGDDVLRKVAAAIADSFLRGSDVVYRYGGEEFCACLTIRPEDARAVVDRLMRNVSALAIPAENASVSDLLTLSVGVAVCKTADLPLEVMLEYADRQLYAAKGEGRGKASVWAC